MSTVSFDYTGKTVIVTGAERVSARRISSFRLSFYSLRFILNNLKLENPAFHSGNFVFFAQWR